MWCSVFLLQRRVSLLFSSLSSCLAGWQGWVDEAMLVPLQRDGINERWRCSRGRETQEHRRRRWEERKKKKKKRHSIIRAEFETRYKVMFRARTKLKWSWMGRSYEIKKKKKTTEELEQTGERRMWREKDYLGEIWR